MENNGALIVDKTASEETEKRNILTKESESKFDTGSVSKGTDMKLPENSSYELVGNDYYYTDDSSGIQYRYDQSKGDWVEATSTNTVSDTEHSKVTTDDEGRQYYWAEGLYLCRDPHGNIFYMDEKSEWKSWSEKPPDGEGKTNENRWYFYKGNDTFFRDNTTNKVYKLKKDTNEWEEYKGKQKRRKGSNDNEEFDTDDDDEESASSEEEGDGRVPPGFQTDPAISYDGNIYTKHDPSDNMTYEWDPDKRAWFPKLDDDFMVTYQLSYGFNPDGTKNENPLKFDDDDDENEKDDKEDEKKKTKEEKGEKQKSGWFDVDDAHNLKVYVSSLPLDMTEETFVEFMSKCGLVYINPETQKFKVKLYTDKEGNFKGDALCTYIKIESVYLALKILDGYRLGNETVKVERAKFTLKGEYNPSLKPKKRRKKEIDKLQKKQEKLFDWRPEPMRGQRMKHENTVIFRNVFDPKEFETATEKLLIHKEAIRGQAETFGQVKKVELFDRHPEGIVKVTFEEVECADMCSATLNNRLYLKRKLSVTTWDGVQKYNVEETEKERNERLRKWEEFLGEKQS